MKNKFSIEKIIDIILLIILCFSPIVISIGFFHQDDLVHPLIGIQVSIADVLIMLTLMLWIIKLIRNKSWTSINLPSKAIFAFLGVMILSVLNASNIQAVVKEVMQATLYFIVLYTIFLQRISHKPFLKKVLIVYIGMVLISVILSSYQCFIEKGTPYLVRALFSNRNLLGGFFVLALPLLFAIILETRKLWIRITSGALILGALTVIYSPFAVLSLFAGFILISILYSSKNSFVILITFLIAVISLIFLSDKKYSVWKDTFSVYEMGSINDNYNRVQHLLLDLPQNVWLRKSFGDKIFTIKDNLFMSSVEPITGIDVNEYPDLEGQQHIKQHYLEWQAALNMVSEKPVLGFGAGDYQSFIGNYYRTLPKVNTMEPNSDNLYLVVASTMGVLGLGMLVWILIFHFKCALMIFKKGSDRFNRIIGLWGAGSLLGISIYAFFTSFMVVGLMPFFIVIIAAIKGNSVKYEGLPVLRVKAKLLLLIIFILVVFVLITSFKEIEKEFTVWFEAEDAEEIISPIELIEDDKASNGMAVKTDVSEHSQDGKAYYPFNVPISGNFYTWFRTYWINGCMNTFKVDFDDDGMYMIGNDLILRNWHWIIGPEYFLNKGKHKLTLTSDSPNSRLDKILITTNENYIPKGLGELFDLVYTFDWKDLPVSVMPGDSKKWKLITTDFIKENRVYYLHKVEREPEYSLIKVGNKNNFLFGLSFKPLLDSKDIHMRLLMGLIDPDNYYYLDFSDSEVLFGSIRNGLEKIYIKNKLKSTLNSMVYNTVTIDRYFPDFRVKLNDEILINTEIDSILFQGSIGFGSKTGEIVFDNLFYKIDLEPKFADNFWETNNDVGGFKEITWFNNVIELVLWKEVSGIWKENAITRDLMGKCMNRTSYALILNGENYWRNYEIVCAVKLPKVSITGICFYYQDTKNYYRFDVEQKNPKRSEIRLIKRQGGVETVLERNQMYIKPEEWYKFQIKIFDNEIIGYIDEKELIRLRDNSFYRGKIGLFTTTKYNPAVFDDIFVRSVKKLENEILDVYTYNFEPRDRSTLDLCDWKIVNCKYQIFRDPGLCIKKSICMNANLINKHSFKDFNMRISFITAPDPTLLTAIMLYDEKGENNYRYEISDRFCKIFKNGILMKKVQGKTIFNTIFIEKKKDRLTLQIDNQFVIMYKDIYPVNNKKHNINIDFEGIAETRIDIKQIVIRRL